MNRRRYIPRQPRNAIAARDGEDARRRREHGARQRGRENRRRVVVAVTLESGNDVGRAVALPLFLQALALRAAALTDGHSALAQVHLLRPEFAKYGTQRRAERSRRRQRREHRIA
jgi:hypothetical protein